MYVLCIRSYTSADREGQTDARSVKSICFGFESRSLAQTHATFRSYWAQIARLFVNRRIQIIKYTLYIYTILVYTIAVRMRARFAAIIRF